ncbi:MAG: GTP cyclohydrolase I FolE [Bacteroidota bacterium]
MTTQTILRQISADIPSHVGNTGKIEMIVPHISAILRILGLDLEEEGLRGTPLRVAKMFVREAFSGLDPAQKPDMTLFENSNGYKEMVTAKEITFFSYCEHHLVPFFGKAHVAYVPKHHLVGLSKLNRLVQYLASKPQTQERLTVEIGTELGKALRTDDVAVVMEATHLCIASRGVKDVNSLTRTSHFCGIFEVKEKKDEFLRQIESE